MEEPKKRGRKKGTPKTGGRRKGTPNKRTKDIMDRLDNEDILGSLVNIANTTEDENIRVKIYLDLLKYIYPQRKAVDIKAADIKLPVINIKGI